jgi:hypothetical protein
MFTDGKEIATRLTMPTHTDHIKVIGHDAEAICGE